MSNKYTLVSFDPKVMEGRYQSMLIAMNMVKPELLVNMTATSGPSISVSTVNRIPDSSVDFPADIGIFIHKSAVNKVVDMLIEEGLASVIGTTTFSRWSKYIGYCIDAVKVNYVNSAYTLVESGNLEHKNDVSTSISNSSGVYSIHKQYRQLSQSSLSAAIRAKNNVESAPYWQDSDDTIMLLLDPQLVICKDNKVFDSMYIVSDAEALKGDSLLSDLFNNECVEPGAITEYGCLSCPMAGDCLNSLMTKAGISPGKSSTHSAKVSEIYQTILSARDNNKLDTEVVSRLRALKLPRQVTEENHSNNSYLEIISAMYAGRTPLTDRIQERIDSIKSALGKLQLEFVSPSLTMDKSYSFEKLDCNKIQINDSNINDTISIRKKVLNKSKDSISFSKSKCSKCSIKKSCKAYYGSVDTSCKGAVSKNDLSKLQYTLESSYSSVINTAISELEFNKEVYKAIFYLSGYEGNGFTISQIVPDSLVKKSADRIYNSILDKSSVSGSSLTQGNPQTKYLAEGLLGSTGAVVERSTNVIRPLALLNIDCPELSTHIKSINNPTLDNWYSYRANRILQSLQENGILYHNTVAGHAGPYSGWKARIALHPRGDYGRLGDLTIYVDLDVVLKAIPIYDTIFNVNCNGLAFEYSNLYSGKRVLTLDSLAFGSGKRWEDTMFLWANRVASRNSKDFSDPVYAKLFHRNNYTSSRQRYAFEDIPNLKDVLFDRKSLTKYFMLHAGGAPITASMTRAAFGNISSVDSYTPVNSVLLMPGTGRVLVLNKDYFRRSGWLHALDTCDSRSSTIVLAGEEFVVPTGSMKYSIPTERNILAYYGKANSIQDSSIERGSTSFAYVNWNSIYVTKPNIPSVAYLNTVDVRKHDQSHITASNLAAICLSENGNLYSTKVSLSTNTGVKTLLKYRILCIDGLVGFYEEDCSSCEYKIPLDISEKELMENEFIAKAASDRVRFMEASTDSRDIDDAKARVISSYVSSIIKLAQSVHRDSSSSSVIPKNSVYIRLYTTPVYEVGSIHSVMDGVENKQISTLLTSSCNPAFTTVSVRDGIKDVSRLSNTVFKSSKKEGLSSNKYKLFCPSIEEVILSSMASQYYISSIINNESQPMFEGFRSSLNDNLSK